MLEAILIILAYLWYLLLVIPKIVWEYLDKLIELNLLGEDLEEAIKLSKEFRLSPRNVEKACTIILKFESTINKEEEEGVKQRINSEIRRYNRQDI